MRVVACQSACSGYLLQNAVEQVMCSRRGGFGLLLYFFHPERPRQRQSRLYIYFGKDFKPLCSRAESKVEGDKRDVDCRDLLMGLW